MKENHPEKNMAALPYHKFELDPRKLGMMNKINWQKYLHPESTALVMVDMQNDALPVVDSSAYSFGATPMWEALDGFNNVRKLVKAARKRGIKIFWIRGGYSGIGKDIPPDTPQAESLALLQAEYPGALSRNTPEFEIVDDIKRLIEPQDIIIDKRTSSSFVGTDLQNILVSAGIKSLLVCGLFTDACVEGTVRSGSDLGYHCLLVADACACTNWDDQYYTCYHLSNIFATITKTDEIVELVEKVN